MNPSDSNHDFDDQVQQLIKILHKLLKKFPAGKYFTDKKGEGSNSAINIYFVNMMPFHPEDLEELEEWYEEQMAFEEGGELMATELTSDDLDFLKQNGIKF